MNDNILKFIRDLTAADTKTLTQKALKTAEEVGELARAALPMEGAHGTNHRFVGPKGVLEEAADTIICALSIVYDLGFTDEDLEEMLEQKAKKWAYLLNREEKFSGKTPYEIHVTVATEDLDSFRGACKILEVKPIILDLQDTGGGTVMVDVMTSSVHVGDNASAYMEMERISQGLDEMGFQVERSKIETVPWHPAAPHRGEDKMPENCYFESHLAVIVTANTEPKLREIAEDNGAHLSRNVFKRIDEDRYKVMVTARSHTGTYLSFKEWLDLIESAIKREGFEIDRIITEFSVFDTKVSHDSSWVRRG